VSLQLMGRVRFLHVLTVTLSFRRASSLPFPRFLLNEAVDRQRQVRDRGFMRIDRDATVMLNSGAHVPAGQTDRLLAL